MKFLEVTFETPSEKSGGGLGIIQSIESLKLCGDVDYIGPEFISESLSIEGDKKYLKYSRKILDRFKSILEGVTSGYYQSWKKVEKDIEWESYDFVFVEFTRYPFVVKAAKTHNIPVVVRVHNVERDYFHNLYLTQKRIVHKLQEIIYSHQERKSIKLCDGMLVLTKEDKERVISLFGEKHCKNIVVNPVCIRDRCRKTKKDREGFLITGSLWYGPNADGVIWFLNNVWKKFSEHSDVPLHIAGSRPNEEIRRLSKLYKNVELIENPEDMLPHFEQASCYIVPIFNGAGMKVKIAEAMMYGIPIIASEHALIGYEYNEATKKFKSVCELMEYMKEIESMPKEDLNTLVAIQRKNYVEKYSINSSANNYTRIISKLQKINSGEDKI